MLSIGHCVVYLCLLPLALCQVKSLTNDVDRNRTIVFSVCVTVGCIAILATIIYCVCRYRRKQNAEGAPIINPFESWKRRNSRRVPSLYLKTDYTRKYQNLTQVVADDPPHIKNSTIISSPKNMQKKDCLVCNIKPQEYRIFPCGHLCACKECAYRLQQNEYPCPVCRKPVENIIKPEIS